MLIKTRLRINATVSVLVAFGVALLLNLSLYRLNKANEAAIFIGQIMTLALERVTLTNDYLLTNSARAKEQWFAKNGQFRKDLVSALEYFQDSEDKKILGNMSETQESREEIFSAIIANRNKRDLYDNEESVNLSLEVEKRLVTQLNMRVYQVVIQGRALQESSNQKRFFALRVAVGCAAILIFIIAAAMANAWALGRIITDRVNRLRNGAMVIGGGDLDHRIDSIGGDEFAELANAFNTMATQLSGSHHDLEIEIEERKKIEETLRQNEERLALTASATQVGMFDWNIKSGSILWTLAHEAIFGYLPNTTTTTSSTTTSEYDYRKWADRVHPGDLPWIEKKVRHCMRHRKPFEEQYRIIWPDGSLHWTESKGVFLYDSDGQASRMLGVVMDITERKQTEEALHESESMFRALFEKSLDAVFLTIPDGRVLSANPAACFMFGMSEEEIIRVGRAGLSDPDNPKFAVALEERKETGRVGGIELGYIRKNGQRFPAEVDSVILPGEPQRSFVIIRDITERKQAEELLRNREERFRLVIENSLDGINMLDLTTGEYTLLSPAQVKMTGFTEEELRGITVEEVYERLHPDDREISITQQNRVAAGENNEEPAEYRWKVKTGEYRWFSDRRKLIRDEEGRPVALVGISRDITERKQAEERIEAALAEKETMLREIHHRVKNNLQVISSLVSLQADTVTDERIREELNDVRDRVRSMALIHEKLYQARDLAQLDFADYVASLMHTLWRSHSALAKNIRLNLAVEPVSISIETAVPCGLILNELAGNALKHAFLDNSSGEVEVGFEIDPATTLICLRVRDNGVGLPAGFDWSQSEGLGLQLVRILAGQLHGTVEIETGPGTEFTIIFPLKENEPG